MARPLCLEYAGVIYHVFSRGNRRDPIYLDDQSFASFLDLLGEACVRFNGIVHAYCLMCPLGRLRGYLVGQCQVPRLAPWRRYREGEMVEVILQSVITCPECGHRKTETMPTDACTYFYECESCGALLKPKPGDCCVFCSFGSVACPPVQEGSGCCTPGE